MSLLFQIIRTGHASGTHHKLALDALAQVTGPYAERWQRLLLKNATLYLEGAKAPDNQFKDFQNHVLHVRDKMWGGARDKTVNWYQHLLAALRDNNWTEAAWCAGVLSHYFTDPIHPFHTGQSAAENTVHRAVEWSISRSYDALVPLSPALSSQEIAVTAADDWLPQLVVAGAMRSNAHYESLLAHYDFKRGVVDPPAGLDGPGRGIVAGLIRYASASFARVLERAFQESAVVPPDVSLTLATVVATLKVPMKAVLKRIDDKALRREVEAIYDELQATGQVVKALPEEQKVVRALYEKEVLAARKPAPGPHNLDAAEALPASKAHPVREHRPFVPRMKDAQAGETPPAAAGALRANRLPTPPAPPVTDFPRKGIVPVMPASAASPMPAPPLAPATEPATADPVPAAQAVTSSPVVPRIARPANVPAPTIEAEAADSTSAETPVVGSVTPAQPEAAEPPALSHAASVSASSAPVVPSITPHLATAAATAAAAAIPSLGAARSMTRPTSSRDDKPAVAPAKDESAKAAPVAPASSDDSDTRFYLVPGQDVVDAPSIGPKTADRLKEVGIHTVADLFAADPGALAETLDVAHIRAKTIAEWQDQARLVCEVPGLRGTHAQLLVGAGYRDLARIARAEPRQLSADVLKFAQSADGQRLLRSGHPPDIEKIMSWAHAAQKALQFKAA